jgi:hypothetical protein
MLTQFPQVKKSVDTAQKEVGWNVVFEVEGVEQLLLTAGLMTHHGDDSYINNMRISYHEQGQYWKGFFNTIRAHLPLAGDSPPSVAERSISVESFPNQKSIHNKKKNTY